MEEYNKNKARIELMDELLKGERSAREDGFITLDEVKKHIDEIEGEGNARSNRKN